MSRRLIAAAAIAVTLLAGCTPSASPAATTPSGEPGKQHNGFTEVQHKLRDGRTVTCLIWDADAGYDSGMSCDWGHAG